MGDARSREDDHRHADMVHDAVAAYRDAEENLRRVTEEAEKSVAAAAAARADKMALLVEAIGGHGAKSRAAKLVGVSAQTVGDLVKRAQDPDV